MQIVLLTYQDPNWSPTQPFVSNPDDLIWGSTYGFFLNQYESDLNTITYNFNNTFIDVAWEKTFTEPLVIIFDECVWPEHLPQLQNYLSEKCCNINNIFVSLTHQSGVKPWWNLYSKWLNYPTFTILETNFVNSYNCKEYAKKQLDKTNIISIDNKQIKYAFSYYGGNGSKLTNVYMFLKMSEFRNKNHIDTHFELPSIESVLGYVEKLTFYQNEHEVKHIEYLYKKYQNNPIEHSPTQTKCKELMQDHTILKKPSRQERLHEQVIASMDDIQWQYDQYCFANVIRETIPDAPYNTLTEKTIRPFLSYLIAIPTSYKAIDYLEQQGFWFPHDLIDYSYQHEPYFYKRFSKVCKVLSYLDSLDHNVLLEYYQKNFDKILTNKKLATDMCKLTYQNFFVKSGNLVEKLINLG